MTRMILNARIGADGVLRLNVPLGPQEAHQDVQVTVEAVTPRKPMTQAEWAAWVQSMAGTWQGDFERPPQGELQERDPL
jgi:hypothetical protein